VTRTKGDGFHLSLSIGKALWDDLTTSALPLKMAEGSYDLGKLVYRGVKQLQVKERVVALLEDRQAPEVVGRARVRASKIWRSRREQVYGTLQEVLRIEGDWRVELDREGTDFHYAHQKIGVDAHMKVLASGTAYLLGNNLEVPFTLERRVGATCFLGDIHYDKDHRAIVGKVEDPSVHIGDNVVLRLLEEAARLVLEQQVHKLKPVTILKKAQLEDLVAPAGGPLKLKMGVDHCVIEVTEEELTLKVRFGFEQLQLTGRVEAS
jgi:hypothetical protein